ncbi:MAG TPA: hypothetical protein VGA32_04965 [Anaerolineales bacterium]
MTSAERRWCWIFSGALAVITSVPYVVGFASQGTEWRFTGFVFAVEDGNSYLAKMLLGASGDWLFRTPYSTMAQRGALAFLPYLLVGKLAAGPTLPEQLIGLFHLFRILATPWAVFATYRFVSLWLNAAWLRRWATALACVGGGLGWAALALPQARPPLEFYSPESFGFLAFLGLPHLILSRALLLDGMSAYVTTTAGGGQGARAAILFTAAGLVQPVVLATAFAVILIHGLLGALFGQFGLAGWLRRAAPILAPAGLLAAAYAAMLAGDPFLQTWARQNRVLSPPPLDYLLAYGVVIGLAMWSVRRGVRDRTFRAWLPLAWAAAFPLLAYAPVNLQRRLPEGTWIVLLILAALGLDQWKRRSLAAAVFAGISLPSTVLLMFGGISTASVPRHPAFYPAAEARAADWLRSTANRSAVVLSAYPVGNRLPARAPVRVVIGHGPETANLDVLLPAVGRFFSSGDDEERRRLLAEQRVNYVFWGPAERELGSWYPGQLAELIRVYVDQGYEIFRVGRP